jgi:tetratricopeptide (TPR) repeat protein
LFYTIYANAFSIAGDYNQAFQQYRKLLALNPNFNGAYYGIGRNHLLTKNYPKAIEAFRQESLPLSRESGTIMYLHSIGKREEALDSLKVFISRYPQLCYRIASVYSYIGEKQHALTWLQKAYDRGDSWLIYIKNDPLLHNIKSEPQYQEILEKMKLN